MQNDTVQICNILCTKFLEYRNLKFTAINGELKMISNNTLIELINHQGFVIIQAERNIPRGKRKNVYIVLINTEKANLKKDGILKIYSIIDKQEGGNMELDEVILIAEPELFKKKHINDVILNKTSENKSGADEKGTKPYYSVYPYTKFRCVVPEHILVPKHEICPPEVLWTFNNILRISNNQFPLIRSYDSMVAWTGAHIGELLKITRNDPHAPQSIEYRLVVK